MLQIIDGLHNGFRVEIWLPEQDQWWLVGEYSLAEYAQALARWELDSAVGRTRLVAATEAVLHDSRAERGCSRDNRRP